RTTINIIPTSSGVKKVIANYSLEQEYCQICKKVYTRGAPDALKGNQFYGHGFKAWVIYQRVALRLPYNSIVESLQEQFHEKINGLDHGVGHSLLLLYDVKAPSGQNSNDFNGLSHYLSNISLSTFMI